MHFISLCFFDLIVLLGSLSSLLCVSELLQVTVLLWGFGLTEVLVTYKFTFSPLYVKKKKKSQIDKKENVESRNKKVKSQVTKKSEVENQN